jgi:type IV pilus assembly protein PilV
MMEVLVTVLLISIGLLGMLAMQSQSIAFTQDSVQRNKAAMLAEELMEILRSDRDEVVNALGFPITASPYFKAKGTDFSNAPDSCVPLPVSPDARLACWAERAKRALPDAANLTASEFYICRSSAPNSCGSSGSAVEIQVAWRVKEGDCLDASVDASLAPTDTVCRYRLRAEL